jgi:hypothetical protein
MAAINYHNYDFSGVTHLNEQNNILAFLEEVKRQGMSIKSLTSQDLGTWCPPPVILMDCKTACRSWAGFVSHDSSRKAPGGKSQEALRKGSPVYMAVALEGKKACIKYYQGRGTAISSENIEECYPVELWYMGVGSKCHILISQSQG